MQRKRERERVGLKTPRHVDKHMSLLTTIHLSLSLFLLMEVSSHHPLHNLGRISWALCILVFSSTLSSHFCALSAICTPSHP